MNQKTVCLFNRKFDTCYVDITAAYEHKKSYFFSFDRNHILIIEFTECLDLFEINYIRSQHRTCLARTSIKKHFKAHQEYKEEMSFPIYLLSPQTMFCEYKSTEVMCTDHLSIQHDMTKRIYEQKKAFLLPFPSSIWREATLMTDSQPG